MKIKIHFAPKGMPKKLPSGPIDEPKPGPTLAREVAAADNEVIKSSCVVESNKVIIIKLKIKIKKKLITEVTTSSDSFLLL